MNWEDLKRKLSSRKFWAALAGFVTAVLYAMNWAESDITQMAGIITAAGVLAAYIFGEAAVDCHRDQYEEEDKAPAVGFDIGGGEE